LALCEAEPGANCGRTGCKIRDNGKFANDFKVMPAPDRALVCHHGNKVRIEARASCRKRVNIDVISANISKYD
jgi:hypothetical protein